MLEKVKKIAQYTILKSSFQSPPSLILFVTSACNLRCKHCFNWQNLNKKDDLSFEEIKKLSRELGPLDSLNISGGEPFLREDLPEIINLFYSNNNLRVVFIPTNGLLPLQISRKLKDILVYAKGKPVNLSFSLDGTEKIHDEIRGVKGSFKKLLESYEEAQKIRSDFPNLSIQVNTVVTNKNVKEIKKLVSVLEAKMPDLGFFSLSFLRGSPRDKTFNLPSIEDLKDLAKYCDRKTTNGSFETKTIDRMIFNLKLKVLKNKKQAIPCEAGRLIGVVMANGDVKHCELHPPIGNLRNDSFSHIWNSAKSRKERQKIISNYCWCTHECFLFPSLVGHPIKGLLAGLV